MSIFTTTGGAVPPQDIDDWGRGPTCPHCGRGEFEPEETLLEFDAAWHCGLCNLFRVPAPGSDSEQKRDEILELIRRTTPEEESAWYLWRFEQITGARNE
ncbi:hypothetical protein [Streptomyces sp. NPDC059063]|uniref:hypothetical protein n=1 Tax=unclassified Streptomyces TaxID=2593676 RepID=UPI00368CBD5C